MIDTCPVCKKPQLLRSTKFITILKGNYIDYYCLVCNSFIKSEKVTVTRKIQNLDRSE
jgi:hypothetical protein